MATSFCNGNTLYKVLMVSLIFGTDSVSLMNSEGMYDQPDGIYEETNIEPTQYDRYEDTNPYWQFGSKTVYNLENTFPLPECKPIQIFMLTRHGTRHSSKNYIEKMSKLIDLISKIDKPKMNEKDVEELKKWKIKNDGTIDKNISSQGIRDMIGLGERIRASFKNLLDEPYDPENDVYKVVVAQKPRCITSAENFMRAALGVENIPDLSNKIDNDILPNLYVLKEQIGGPADESQINEFKKSDAIAKVLSRVAEKMGLKKGVITFEEIETMYESCRQNRAMNPKSIPVWCRVFSVEDLKILEYMDDLGWYYSFGYGCPLHEKIVCPLLVQLNNSFKEKVQGRGPKGVFGFGHRSNQIAAVVMLGVAKDDKQLTYDNMEEMEDRKWRTSTLNPFGANTTAVLYDCGDGEMKVSFYINEVITSIQLENGYTCELCPWKLVEQKFDDKIRNCLEKN